MGIISGGGILGAIRKKKSVENALNEYDATVQSFVDAIDSSKKSEIQKYFEAGRQKVAETGDIAKGFETAKTLKDFIDSTKQPSSETKIAQETSLTTGQPVPETMSLEEQGKLRQQATITMKKEEAKAGLQAKADVELEQNQLKTKSLVNMFKTGLDRTNYIRERMNKKYPGFSDTTFEGVATRTAVGALNKLTTEDPELNSYMIGLRSKAVKMARDIEGGRVTNQDMENQLKILLNPLGAPLKQDLYMVLDHVQSWIDSGLAKENDPVIQTLKKEIFKQLIKYMSKEELTSYKEQMLNE